MFTCHITEARKKKKKPKPARKHVTTNSTCDSNESSITNVDFLKVLAKDFNSDKSNNELSECLESAIQDEATSVNDIFVFTGNNNYDEDSCSLLSDITRDTEGSILCSEETQRKIEDEKKMLTSEAQRTKHVDKEKDGKDSQIFFSNNNCSNNSEMAQNAKEAQCDVPRFSSALQISELETSSTSKVNDLQCIEHAMGKEENTVIYLSSSPTTNQETKDNTDCSSLVFKEVDEWTTGSTTNTSTAKHQTTITSVANNCDVQDELTILSHDELSDTSSALLSISQSIFKEIGGKRENISIVEQATFSSDTNFTEEANNYLPKRPLKKRNLVNETDNNNKNYIVEKEETNDCSVVVDTNNKLSLLTPTIDIDNPCTWDQFEKILTPKRNNTKKSLFLFPDDKFETQDEVDSIKTVSKDTTSPSKNITTKPHENLENSTYNNLNTSHMANKTEPLSSPKPDTIENLFNKNIFNRVFAVECSHDKKTTNTKSPPISDLINKTQTEQNQPMQMHSLMLSSFDVFAFLNQLSTNMLPDQSEHVHDLYNYGVSDVSIKSDGDINMLSFDVQEKNHEPEEVVETKANEHVGVLQEPTAKMKKRKKRKRLNITSWTRNGAKFCSNKTNEKPCPQCDLSKSAYLQYECWLCSIHTHQITVHHKPIQILETSNTMKNTKESFLKCTGCKRHQCSKCVQLFFDFTKKLFKDENPESICPEIMLYLTEVEHFLQKAATTDKRIIHDGDPMWMSCCHWSKHKLYKEKARKAMKEVWKFENKTVLQQQNFQRKKLKPNHTDETTILHDQNLGGAFYADCWVAIKAHVRFPMVKVLARESIKGSTGRGHAVISQEDAIKYAMKNIKAIDAHTSSQCPNELYRITKQMIFEDVHSTDMQQLQVKIIVLDTRYCNGPMEVDNGTETLPDILIPYLVYYSPDFFEEELERGIDVICFVCPPYLPHLNGDMVCSVYLAPKFQAPSQSNITLQESLWLRMWKENPAIDRMERSRTGGPNGIAKPDTSMFLLMNIPNSSPRQSSSCLWIPFGTIIIVVYISLEQKKRTLKCHAYSPVKPASKVKGFDLEDLNNQARKKKNRTDTVLISTLMNFVHVKALAVPILETMNSYKLQDSNGSLFVVSPEALNVQKMTNFMAEWYALQTTTKGNFKYKLQYCNYLCKTCCFTLLMYPTAYHYDNPGKRAFSDKKFVLFFKENLMKADNWIQSGMTEEQLDNVINWLAKSKSFVENKQLFEFTTDLPLSGTWGRGGSDLQYKVGAIVDHTHRVGDFPWRGEPPTQRFLNALIRIGRELDVGNGNDEIILIPE